MSKLGNGRNNLYVLFINHLVLTEIINNTKKYNSQLLKKIFLSYENKAFLNSIKNFLYSWRCVVSVNLEIMDAHS